VYKGVEQATSNIQMIGQVYGLAPSANAGIDKINFTIGLAPGSPSIDLEKMTIMYSNETVAPSLRIYGTDYGTSVTAGVTKFVATNQGAKVTTMSAQDQVTISFMISGVPKNTKVTIELRPAVGASLPFQRQIPATIQQVNVLY